MRILDFYIARTILYQTAMVFAVLLGLFTFVTVLDQLSDFGEGTYSILQILRYVALTIPRTIYELFPMAALLGSILGMSHLVVDSEIIIMRVSGVSNWRIVGSVVKVSILFALSAILIGELVMPRAETMAQRGRAEALQQNIKQQSNFGLWMRDKKTYVNIGEVFPDLTLQNIRVFEFDDSGHLRSIVYAGDGTYEYADRHWRLFDVKQTLVSHSGAVSSIIPKAVWKTEVTPDILEIFQIKPGQMPLWQLNQYINHLRDNNQSTNQFRLAFWSKIVSPLSTIVMVLLALPFLPKQTRTGSLGRSLLIGIMVGLGFYVANKSFGYFVQVYDISPILGASLPALLCLGIAIYLLRRVS